MEHAEHEPMPKNPTVEACIQACNDCWLACLRCSTAMAGMTSHNACPRCCNECAVICRTCVELMTMNSSFAPDVCEACAEVCDWCAEQCGQHDHAHCQACAAACRTCADACRKMTAAG